MKIINIKHRLNNGEEVVYIELPKHYFNEWKKGRIYLNIFDNDIDSVINEFSIDDTNIMIMRDTLQNLKFKYNPKTDIYYDGDNYDHSYISYNAINDDLIDIDCTIKDRGAYVDIIFETIS